MGQVSTTVAPKIDKKHVAAMSAFAIKYIPDTDSNTLNQFMELLNTNGSHGWLSAEQLLVAMRVMVGCVPGTHVDSLLTLIELLDIYLPLKGKCGEDWTAFLLAEPTLQVKLASYKALKAN